MAKNQNDIIITLSVLFTLFFLQKRKDTSIGNIGNFICGKGYINRSISRRGAFAKEKGIYPKTQFKQEYKISQRIFNILIDIGYIVYSEWHHTSAFLNKTEFYRWVDWDVMLVVLRNKQKLRKLSNEKIIDLVKRELDIDKEGFNDIEYRKYICEFLPDIPEIYTFSDGIEINTLTKEVNDPHGEVNKNFRKKRRQLFRDIRQSIYSKKLIKSKSYEDWKNSK